MNSVPFSRSAGASGWEGFRPRAILLRCPRADGTCAQYPQKESLQCDTDCNNVR